MLVDLSTFSLGIGKLCEIENWNYNIYGEYFSIPTEINNIKYTLNLKTNCKLFIINNFPKIKLIEMFKNISEDFFKDSEENKLIYVDYYRQKLLFPNWIINQDIYDKETTNYILKKLLDKQKRVLFYGSYYEDDKKYFKFSEENTHSKCGIHFLHMNQGWKKETDNYENNVTNHDGICIFEDVNGIYTALMCVQDSQILPTNNFGQPNEII